MLDRLMADMLLDAYQDDAGAGGGQDASIAVARVAPATGA
jgi:hypothetical protein